MKQFGNLKTLLTAGAAVATIATFGSLQAQDMQQGEGVVRRVTGTAQYQTGGGVWMPISKGTKLPAGATIKTDKEAQVDVYLGALNGPSLRVTDDTTVSIDALNYTGSGEDAVSETKLNLQDGRILGSVRKLGQASKYEIKTPTGVAGIRGTDYDISTHKNAAGKQVTYYTAISGTLVIADNQNGPMNSVIADAGGGTVHFGGTDTTPQPGPTPGETPIQPPGTLGGGGTPPVNPPGGPQTQPNPVVVVISTHN